MVEMACRLEKVAVYVEGSSTIVIAVIVACIVLIAVVIMALLLK